MKSISVGFPSMHIETNERRAFLPDFIAHLEQSGAQVVLEYSYGSGMGFREGDYQNLAPGVRFAENPETYRQDYVFVLRSPNEAELMQLYPGSCLVSMLHYATNPQRTEFIRSLGVSAISLDSITDDEGRRLVENMPAVAWNGLEAAFAELESDYPEPGFESPDRGPIRVTLLGSGAVGMQVVPAAIRYADVERWQRMASMGIPGVQVRVVDYDTTGFEEIMLDLLSESDMLVDATQRPDPSLPIIPNSWIGVMPKHAVLLDLTVDPYDWAEPPGGVKGIEGMPHGSLDHYVFQTEDPLWDQTVPENIPSLHRRTAVSCYSWPGVQPVECMAHYGKQLEPLMKSLIQTGYDNLSLEGDIYQRALYRASIKAM
ncbi:MAG: alanine dehydrogenase [Chloroflexota bacterium]|nr:alanine dehydrogenase [Chloroflexota bacterium]